MRRRTMTRHTGAIIACAQRARPGTAEAALHSPRGRDRLAGLSFSLGAVLAPRLQSTVPPSLPKLTLCALSDVAAGAAEARSRKIRHLRAEAGEVRLNKSWVKRPGGRRSFSLSKFLEEREAGWTRKNHTQGQCRLKRIGPLRSSHSTRSTPICMSGTSRIHPRTPSTSTSYSLPPICVLRTLLTWITCPAGS